MSDSVSVIIPHHHDEEALRRLLKDLAHLREQVSESLEVLVVDGGQSKTCQNLCQDFQAVYITANPCRGQQLKTGGTLAKGSIFWFLHADSRVNIAHLKHIIEAEKAGFKAGYFRFAFAGEPDWRKRFVAWWVHARIRLGGVPYGDQGLFVDTQHYKNVGGHAEIPLFEEVRLVRALRRTGRFVMLGYALEVDPRRWHRDGFLRRTILNRICALAFICGVSPERIARWYVRARGRSR